MMGRDKDTYLSPIAESLYEFVLFKVAVLLQANSV